MVLNHSIPFRFSKFIHFSSFRFFENVQEPEVEIGRWGEEDPGLSAAVQRADSAAGRTDAIQYGNKIEIS